MPEYVIDEAAGLELLMDGFRSGLGTVLVNQGQQLGPVLDSYLDAAVTRVLTDPAMRYELEAVVSARLEAIRTGAPITFVPRTIKPSPAVSGGTDL